MLKLIRLTTRYFILDIQKAAELGPLITFVVNFNFKQSSLAFIGALVVN